MAEVVRCLPAGSHALLAELDGLDATLSLCDALRAEPPNGVIELVPAARTVLIRFDPSVTDADRLARHIAGVDLATRAMPDGKVIDLPVAYDGEDLGDVGRALGLDVAEVIRRHAAATFTVAFTGFAPGFAYMSCDDPVFDVPRRAAPRPRIPAGSVALAGRFCAVYPTASPGGWQLIGRTQRAMWDLDRDPAALLAPGDRVRFRAVAESEMHPLADAAPSSCDASPRAGLRVTRADRPALFQDRGREGRAAEGISASGALDQMAFREANLCVGNPREAPALEVTFGGFALRADRAATLAVTGAPCAPRIRAADGRTLDAPMTAPFALDTGDELVLGAPSEGMRSYVALRGGFAVALVLGSASTDTLARVGPPPIGMGDVLVPANGPATSVDTGRPRPGRLPRSGEVVEIEIMLGPRDDWFTSRGIESLLGQEWEITADSSRVGMRLRGGTPIDWREEGELPSEGTVRGAIQVPRNGQPVLFLADHPVTGGYPVIGVVAAKHLDLAGQAPIGARLRFRRPGTCLKGKTDR